jgi:CRISPR type IV-associated DEAD/DEAH-box helicase Csf4
VRAALLYSATLYLPSKTGEASCHYIRVKLGVPLERSISFAPLYYRDVLSPLMLLPSPAAAPALTYPGGSGQSEEDDDSPSPSDGTDASSRYGAWVGNCSQQIVIAADTARGGTLVLCTSFSDLRAIAGRMPASMQDRLVDPAGEHTVPRNAALFRKLHRSGKRPIWIATGAAWTGLDLRDEQAETAEADTLLTDLVIVRTPLCLVRTTTQLQRREWMGFESDMFEALIRLKQGLGRLVRRPGLHDRRIHVLDGRLVTLSKPHFRFYRRFLEDYRNKGELSGAHTPLPASKSQGT